MYHRYKAIRHPQGGVGIWDTLTEKPLLVKVLSMKSAKIICKKMNKEYLSQLVGKYSSIKLKNKNGRKKKCLKIPLINLED